MTYYSSATFLVLLLVATNGCRQPDYADSRPGDPARNQRLSEAELIGAAMFVYADRHAGKLPETLEALKPDYLGASVDTTFLSLNYPGATVLVPRDYRVLASEKVHDKDNRFICIYGHRGVGLLREGD